MKTVSIISLVLLTILGTIVGCSIMKGNDAERNVRRYLARFETDLKKDDSLALQHFQTDHSAWALQAAIRVLRNEAESPVTVTLQIPEAQVKISDSIAVEIPLLLKADSAGIMAQRLTVVTMTLVQHDTTFLILRWNGQQFYEEFYSYSNAIRAGQNAHEVSQTRGEFYTRARELQNTYDSVVWFSMTETPYYYVVKGTWEYPYNDNPLRGNNYNMGLVDESGKTIVPVEFDLIGMPGSVGEDLIEVKNDGLYGCYKISTAQQVIPTAFDWIIPYEKLFLVKNDTTVGWYDQQYAFHAGYPDQKAEAHIKGFKFFPESIRLENTSSQYLEIPNETYAAVGYLVPDSYYTYFGIFREIEGDFEGEIFNESAGVEYKEASVSFIEKVADKFSALITNARDGYLYGREDFYEHQKVQLMNKKGEVFTVPDYGSLGHLSFKMIDSTLLQIKIDRYYSSVEYFEPMEEETEETAEESMPEVTVPYYQYFSASGETLLPLKSNRGFACTQFIKLDSSYITGDVIRQDDGTEADKSTALFSTTTLTAMRNEILAEYGYIFRDPEVLRTFKYRDWYKPEYATVADIVGELSEIDLHNLKFLEKILGPMDGSPTFL